jgi:hypothetical protein
MKSSFLPAAAVSFVALLIAILAFSAVAETLPGSLIIRGETRDGFPFMMGGFGQSERERMKQMSDEYNLKLTFVDRSGDYLSDVTVVVQNDKGEEVVNLDTQGPWFYVKLPPGEYDVKARVGDEWTGIGDIAITAGERVAKILSWKLAETALASAERSPR